MAVLTKQEKIEIMQRVERVANRKGVSIHWLKAEIGDALQAVEDRWEANPTQNALANDIENAAPGVFSAAEKRYLLAFWLIHKGRRVEESL